MEGAVTAKVGISGRSHEIQKTHLTPKNTKKAGNFKGGYGADPRAVDL